MYSVSNQRSGCICANQHTEKKLARVKMAACGWGGWDLNSRFFSVKRFLWIHIHTVIKEYKFPLLSHVCVWFWIDPMTSIHFVVHPLPGTEDQLNDRYFIAAQGSAWFKSIFMCGVRYKLLETIFTVCWHFHTDVLGF